MTWAAVIEVLHVASLIHDDILDDSYSRRGLETAHIIYEKKRATFSANYLIGRAYDLISYKLEEERSQNWRI